MPTLIRIRSTRTFSGWRNTYVERSSAFSCRTGVIPEISSYDNSNAIKSRTSTGWSRQISRAIPMDFSERGRSGRGANDEFRTS